MSKIILSLLLPILVVNCFSQSVPPSEIGLGTGLSYYALKNELVSPYTYKGTTAPFQIMARLNSAVNRHYIQLQFATVQLNSASDALAMQDVYRSIQYSYHRKILPRKNFTIFAGIVFDSKYTQRSNNGNGVLAGSNSYDQLILSLSPSLCVEKQFRKDWISLQLWTALTTYVLEPSYALSYYQTDLLWPNNYTELDVRFSYSKYIASRWSARLNYWFQYYRLSRYETTASVNHQIVFSVLYTIKKS